MSDSRLIPIKFTLADDFERQVISFAGIPIDPIDINEAKLRITRACKSNRRLFYSTPNVNFLVKAQEDKQFRRSLIESDLVTIDGMPLIWIAWIMGMKKLSKVSGSDVFDLLLSNLSEPKLKVLFFGGEPGAAKEAHNMTNRKARGISSTGFLNPGYGEVEELSSQKVIDQLNDPAYDFLVVALGAEKGQKWILSNKDKLSAPAISHLGAVINFTAKRTIRAPAALRENGLEWLWRIKEQPSLGKRYFRDAIKLVTLLFSKILLYIYLQKRQSFKRSPKTISIDSVIDSHHNLKLSLSGSLTKSELDSLHGKILVHENIQELILDLSALENIDEYGLGCFLVLEKHFKDNLRLVGVSKHFERILKINHLGSRVC